MINKLVRKISNLFVVIKLELLYFVKGQLSVTNYIRTLDDPIPALKYLGSTIGDGTYIWPGITINCEKREKYKLLNIGSTARILWDVIIDLNDEVIIGDYAHIGARSSIITHYNLGETPLGLTEYPMESGSVIVGKGVAVAWNCIIMHNSKIGDHSIIAVGSVVSGEIPEFCVLAGNPGRPVKKIIPQNPEEFNI